MTVTVNVPVDEVAVTVSPETTEVNVTINQGVPVPVPGDGGNTPLQKTLLVADRGEAGDPISGTRQFYLPTAADYTIFIGTAPIHEGIDYNRTGNLITLTEEYGDLAPNEKILLLI